jgi:lipopolysaccharide transport system ATP-binding protein
MNGAIMGMTKAEIRSKLDEIIDFSGVEQYINTPVKRYSSGMYVRLAFAVAAHLESEILIVDEVLAVGDAEFQKKCLGKMGDVSKNEGRTVLFVSHHLSSIKDLCNTGIMLNKGKVHYVGDATGAINQYLSFFNPQKLSVSDDYQDKHGVVACKLLQHPDSGEEVHELIADQLLCVQFKVKGYNRKLKGISIGVRLLDSSGNAIGTLFSDYYGYRFDLEPDETITITATNREVYLSGGTYTLLIELWSEQKQLKSTMESITFNVLPADVFKQGFGLIPGTKYHGPLLWKSDWKIKQEKVYKQLV